MPIIEEMYPSPRPTAPSLYDAPKPNGDSRWRLCNYDGPWKSGPLTSTPDGHEGADTCNMLVVVEWTAVLAVVDEGDTCCAIGVVLDGPPEASARYLYDHAAFKARLAADPASGGYPPGFSDWPLEPRNKWFADNTSAVLADSDHLVGMRPEADDPLADIGKNWDAQPQPPEIITRRASDIKPEPIDWLWKGWLAKAKLQLIAGVPEAGKTTIALSYAATVSSGGMWPDCTRAAVGNVLIWTSEDDPADTLIPRLMRMGADLSRIHFIEQTRGQGGKPRPFNPATDMEALEKKAKEIGDVALLIIDPIVAAIPMSRNSHNNAETRNGMQPVVDFGKAIKAAVIGISHLAKGTNGMDPLECVIGSAAFGALPRLVMFAAKNEAEGDDHPERIMVRVKSNIGSSGGGFGYHIDARPLIERPDIEATSIVWESALEGHARELLADAEAEDGTAKAPKIRTGQAIFAGHLGERQAAAKGNRSQGRGRRDCFFDASPRIPRNLHQKKGRIRRLGLVAGMSKKTKLSKPCSIVPFVPFEETCSLRRE